MNPCVRYRAAWARFVNLTRDRDTNALRASQAGSFELTEATRPSRFPPGALRASLQTRQARAEARSANLAPFIVELRAVGITSRRRIAAALNQRGVPTPSGHGRWHATQVERLLKRLAG